MAGRAIGPVPDSPQERALRSDADIVIMGGANGGMKTYTLALAPLAAAREDAECRGVTFRRTRPELKQGGGLVDETKGLYRPFGATLNRNELEWRFPPPGDDSGEGARLQLRSLQYEEDAESYDGGQFTFLGFDQLEQFTAFQFFYLLGRMRSATSTWDPFCFATCNPAPKGHWLYEFIKPWLDEDNAYPSPGKAGQRLHFFPEGKGRWRWVDPGATQHIERPDGETVEVGPLSVEFHPSTVFDNPFILEHDPGYVQRLNALPRKIKMAKLHGKWGVRLSDGPLSEHAIQVVSPDEVPNGLKWVRYWDLADSEPTPKNPKPSHTAGVKAAVIHRQWTTCGFGDEQGDEGCTYWKKGGADEVECPSCGKRSLMTGRMPVMIVGHATWFQMSGHQKKSRMVSVAKRDGRGTTIGVEREGGATGKEGGEDYKRQVFPRGYRVKLDNPTGDKMARIGMWSDLAETGRMWVVDAPWAGDYIDALELLEPLDVADATGGAYKLAKQYAGSTTDDTGIGEVFAAGGARLGSDEF